MSAQMPEWQRTYRLNFSTDHDPDPPAWPDDCGAKRIPIFDHNFQPPRLVRVVGWVNCLSHRKHRWLSPDVRRVRTCDDCKRADAEAEARERQALE